MNRNEILSQLLFCNQCLKPVQIAKENYRAEFFISKCLHIICRDCFEDERFCNFCTSETSFYPLKLEICRKLTRTPKKIIEKPIEILEFQLNNAMTIIQLKQNEIKNLKELLRLARQKIKNLKFKNSSDCGLAISNNYCTIQPCDYNSDLIELISKNEDEIKLEKLKNSFIESISSSETI